MPARHHAGLKAPTGRTGRRSSRSNPVRLPPQNPAMSIISLDKGRALGSTVARVGWRSLQVAAVILVVVVPFGYTVTGANSDVLMGALAGLTVGIGLNGADGGAERPRRRHPDRLDRGSRNGADRRHHSGQSLGRARDPGAGALHRADRRARRDAHPGLPGSPQGIGSRLGSPRGGTAIRAWRIRRYGGLPLPDRTKRALRGVLQPKPGGDALFASAPRARVHLGGRGRPGYLPRGPTRQTRTAPST